MRYHFYYRDHNSQEAFFQSKVHQKPFCGRAAFLQMPGEFSARCRKHR